MASKAGFTRVYPSVSIAKSYDFQKRTWWREALAHPNRMILTSPYYDASGAGIVVSFVHTIYRKNPTQTTAVVGADFALKYFDLFVSKVYPSCEKDFGCIIIDDSGFIVMHPKIKNITEESQFQEPRHISIEEHSIAEEMINRNILNSNICQDFSKNKNLRSYRVTLPLHIERGFESEVFEMRPIPESNLFIIRVKQKPSLNGCSCVSTSPDDLLCNDHCDCLCHRPIQFDVCTNKYDTKEASPPCSARLPDTSANNEPDILDGLSACFDPACPRKQNKTDCLSEGECSWCEFTDTKEQIETPCCRLKEECTFGKTKSTSRHTCAKPLPASAPRTTDINKAAIVGATVGCVLVFILIILAVLYCYRHHHPVPDDLYIDAVADMNEISNYIHPERGMSGVNDQYPYKCKPEINNLYSESNSF
ncbi:VWFA and cache domain-containing protein 1-like [Mytilus californianus]|uniref:VWFA and cache domain-containing protein 1-like n=1 Tax=Mytilus californianus TaxID=6549 RepID=UPI002246E1AE|nr:VWFA and cache domain-containing protein 1-like [Mytilus californianus]XP_052072972.1 VWFA and cache domain-containing protein 1-like [Mytilus californianus]